MSQPVTLKRLHVSTHSRAEAAANKKAQSKDERLVSTHSRAEAAAHKFRELHHFQTVSTHSRAEAAAYNNNLLK